MVKICTRGNHEVDVSLFSKSSRSKDGLMRWCKPCVAQYERERYQSGDKERKQKNKNNTIQRARDYIWKVLSESNCVDCGIDDPMVLEFDHKEDSGKLYNVASMHALSVDRIKAEIAKCEIRCANCHKKKTARQFGFWRTSR